MTLKNTSLETISPVPRIEVPRVVVNPDVSAELILGSEGSLSEGIADAMDQDGNIVLVETQPADYTEAEAQAMIEEGRTYFFENLATRIGVAPAFLESYLKGHAIDPELAVSMPAAELNELIAKAKRDDFLDREPGDSRFYNPAVALERRANIRQEQEQTEHKATQSQASVLRYRRTGRVVLGSRGMDWDVAVYLEPNLYYIGPDHTLEPQSDV